MIILAMAIYCEAKPLIEKYRLKKDESYMPFTVFANEEKEIFIEGSGLNKQLRNINGLNNYVLTVNCENYQILT